LRAVLLDIVKDELDRLRTRVDWAIIEGREGSQSKACHQFEFVLQHPNIIWFVSFSHLLFGVWIKRREIAAQREERAKMFSESPPWIREVQANCAWLFMRAALLNSPVWWPFIPLLLFASQLSGKAYRWWNDIQYCATRVGDGAPDICFGTQPA
jgi:hypothetical protein